MIPTFCAGPGGLKGSGDARATALGREVELQQPWIAERRLDRDAVDPDQGRRRESAALQHHAHGR